MELKPNFGKEREADGQINSFLDKNNLDYLISNAALRCEQRNTKAAAYHLKHKTQRWNEKCQALGITLKYFVSPSLT